MARMIPATIHSAVRSGAERLMFNTIKGAARTENWNLPTFPRTRKASIKASRRDRFRTRHDARLIRSRSEGRTNKAPGRRMDLYRSVRSGTSKQRGSIRAGRKCDIHARTRTSP